MNKVYNINLGGYPFTIDDDAYEHLSGYLKTIHRHFRKSEGYEEITGDIEARIAELFQERMGTRAIVDLKMVQDAIVIMGTPEEFGAEAFDSDYSAPKTERTHRTENRYKTGKRLFRDPDDQVIGGVCSGIAAYFGIADPLWVRLFFVIFTLSGGFGVPVYIILWAILKEAKTSSDRLAMRGDDINVSNIAKIIEEEFENISEKITGMTDGWDEKGKKKIADTTRQSLPYLRKAIRLLGQLVVKLLTIIKTVIAPVGALIGVALAIAFGAVWVVSLFGFILGFPYLGFIMPEHGYLGGIWLLNLVLLVGIPIISVILLLGRLFFRNQYRVRWNAGLIVFFILNAISFFGISSYFARQFKVPAEAYQESERFGTGEDDLTISFSEVAPATRFSEWFDGEEPPLKVSDGKLYAEMVELRLEKAQDDEFVLIKEGRARGKELSEAKYLAKNIRHQTALSGNQLEIQPFLWLENGEKWRVQQQILILQIPEGKTITFQKVPAHLRSQIEFRGEHSERLYPTDGEAYTLVGEELQRLN